MNINESHYPASPRAEEGEGSRGVQGGPAQGGNVGATMETQCPVEDGAPAEEARPIACPVVRHVTADAPLHVGALLHGDRLCEVAGLVDVVA